MKNKISGSARLSLPADAGGNVGYSLTYDYEHDQDNMVETIKFSNIEFSGPGTWDDFSEGEDYPYDQMLDFVRDSSLQDELEHLRKENSALKKG